MYFTKCFTILQEAEQRRLEQRLPPKRESRGVASGGFPNPSTAAGGGGPLHHSTSVPRLDSTANTTINSTTSSTANLNHYRSGSIGSCSSSINNINNVGTNSSTTTATRYPHSEYVLKRALEPHNRTLSSDHINRSNNNIDNNSINNNNQFHHNLQHHQEQPVNRNTDPNFWRNQATTYQPLATTNGRFLFLLYE